MSIDFLKNHAASLREHSQGTSMRASLNQDDFFLRMAAKNQKQAALDAENDLRIAYAQEAGELIDLRFLGPKADGSISLESFIKITEPLLKAWKSAAHRLRHGVVQSKVGNEIGDILNLKLAGLAPGSTRVLVTGNSASDLSGESLLTSTLTQTFRLLNTTNADFYDAVDAVGGRSAKYFEEALKAIDAAGLSAEFSWTGNTQSHKWLGSTDEMRRIRALIASVSAPETYSETVTGHVAGIKDTGRLEVRTAQGKITIRFPLDLTASVQRLAIAKPATIEVKTTRYTDPISRKDVFKRIMVSVHDS